MVSCCKLNDKVKINPKAVKGSRWYITEGNIFILNPKACTMNYTWYRIKQNKKLSKSPTSISRKTEKYFLAKNNTTVFVCAGLFVFKSAVVLALTRLLGQGQGVFTTSLHYQNKYRSIHLIHTINSMATTYRLRNLSHPLYSNIFVVSIKYFALSHCRIAKS